MRRREKEINDLKVIENIIKRAKVCRIGLSQNNIAYIVPMNFGYINKTLYFHSAKEGKKIDILRQNNKVSFEIDVKIEIIESNIACDWGMKYLSVMGQGEAFFINELEKKKEAMTIIMEHYMSNKNWKFEKITLENVCVFKVNITEISGKQSGFKNYCV